MMTEYTVVLERSVDGTWGAYVPDLAGCTAGGATSEEALEAVRESISLWIEEARASGLALPQPQSRATTVRVAV